MSAIYPDASFGYSSVAGLNIPAPASGISYGYNASTAAAAQPTQAGQFQLDEDINAEIESRLQVFLKRRPPVLRRQVIKVPGPAGRVQQVVRRIPTPQPDVIEKVFVVKPQRDVVNLLIERPGTPPPQVQERREVEPAHRPVITQQVVRVEPRTKAAQIQVAPQPIQQQPQQIPLASYPVAYQTAYQTGYQTGYQTYPSTYSYGASVYSGYGAPVEAGSYAAYPGYANYPGYGSFAQN